MLAFEKLKPKLEHLNPVEGVKRMFSMDNLVEVLKAVLKTALLLLIGWLVVQAALPQIVGLARSPEQPVQVIGALMWDLTVQAVAWTLGTFALVSLLDAAYQRHSFIKKMRMSLRDIRQEMKESEGDPHIKQQRKQAHQEWSQRNAAQAARTANVLVVNPTHVAIAIDYDRETAPVPSIAAKGEDFVARAMREAAEEAGVPIVRNVPLARDLLARGEIGETGAERPVRDHRRGDPVGTRGARARGCATARRRGPRRHRPAAGAAHRGARRRPDALPGRTMESFFLSFLSMLLALAFVLALAYGAARLLRARLSPRTSNGGAGDDALRFVRALPVGAKERVVIVEHRGERWLLGVTGGGISTIAHWRAGDASAAVGDASMRATPNCGRT